ncbi:DUF1983 domain-containing protein [Caballeronia sp. LjRoot34]
MAGSTGDYAGSTQIYAGVYTEISARAEADLALAVKTDTIAAQSQSATSNLTAAVRTETTARVDADSALASQVTTVQANVDANTALIQNEATARADADSAQATQISTVQASVTGLSAAVQTNANSYADLSGKVSASYSIKTQITANGRTYIAGIGVGTDNNGGIIESQVLFSASRVAIIDPNGSAVTAPFVVQGGQVFMSQALIGTGWITNLMIGDIIQSTALGANGQPLWILNKNSGITFNGANIGSGYAVSDNTGGRAYDNNGTLRVRWGVWA